MKSNKNPTLYPPLIFNVFKPARITSYDVIRHFKRNLPNGFGKIGHFGTLDPFACGVLMIGIAGAARVNDFIHSFLPKTYLAVGKLGVETPTGDYTSEASQLDDSLYLKNEISRFPKAFIEERLRTKFLGAYLQTPHKYSASKFMGKNLHEWAREGIEVKKEAVARHIYSIEVVKYRFPYLSVRVKVSSGTYVRSLFTEFANDLGTLGTLVSLVRESVGHVNSRDAIFRQGWPVEKSPQIINKAMRVDQVLPFSQIVLTSSQAGKFKNGAFLAPRELTIPHTPKFSDEYFWMVDESNQLLGMGQKTGPEEIRPKMNFHSEDQAVSS